MKRSGFRQQTIEEVRQKQAVKRAKNASKPKVPIVLKKAKKVAKQAKKPRVKTQSQLKKILDSVFSVHIRKKYADADGNTACYTCGKILPWQHIQNGHFVSRQYLATRWNEDNCRPQCWGCNGYGNGKPLDFEENLKRELGEEHVEKMKASRHQILKLDRHWYAEQIEKYKQV